MEAITYLREALERRIFKQREEEYSVNQRLRTYFETLVTQNPDAEQTLTAESAQPLLQSLELSQPEILLAILAPVVIGFFILAVLLSWIRDNWLVQREETEEVPVTPSELKESAQVLPES